MSDLTLPAARDRALPERARGLLDIPEDQWFERKSIRTKPTDLAETLVAMANAEGGTVVVGLWDGAVEGTERYISSRNELQQAAIDHTIPPVRVLTSLLDVQRSDGQPDRLLLLQVPPSEVVHATNRDRVLLRVGDESRKLNFSQRQELLYDKGQAHFDSTPVPGVTLGDLDPQLLGEFLGRLRTTDAEHTLKSLGLLTRNSEVTSAAYLLFASTPQDEFTEAYVRILRYRGTERGTGIRQGLTDDVRCTGPIPTMLELARAELQRLQPTRRALASSGRFEQRGLIPEDAWLEGLVNAVIHRSYSLGGDHIRIEVFDDRIDVHSPGRFPGLSRPAKEDPRSIVRFARNPRIAKSCSVLQFGQELGEGIRRIYDEMRLAGLADPIFHETAQSVHLRLEAVQVDIGLMATMPAEARQVMALLKDAGGMSTGDIATTLGRSRPKAIRVLKAMEEANLVDWVGNSPKDPRAYWRIHSE
jgi:ATP-dependent DNA helicase RecG